MGKYNRKALKRKVLPLRIAAFCLPIALILVLCFTYFSHNTYVITDGDRVITHTTSSTDPMQVLDEAGLELDEDDIVTTQVENGTSEITVRRRQTIHINYYGEDMTVTSHGETVAQLLNRLNLPLTKDDTISTTLDQETYDGMTLRVESVIHQDQTYTCSIPHGVSYCYDPALPEGMEVVLTEGTDGELLCTATVTYVNSKETSRTLLSESVTRNAVDEVIAIGTGLASETQPASDVPIILDNIIILPSGEVLTYTHTTTAYATAYYNRGTTAMGTVAQEGVVAVDPSFIHFGCRMFIITKDGAYIYGIAAAEDAGDDNIVGNRIDLWYPTKQECLEFGYRECIIYFLGTEE